MNAPVFWISATQLDFRERIYTWDGRCWTDKNGISRTVYLRNNGVITADCKGGSKGNKQKGASKGKNNKGDNKGKKAKDIQFDGDNQDDDKDTGIPNGLQGVGYGKEDLEDLTERSYAQKRLIDNAPCPVSREQMKDLFEDSLSYW